jgi:alpha/beta superfamily hydrolase
MKSMEKKFKNLLLFFLCSFSVSSAVFANVSQVEQVTLVMKDGVLLKGTFTRPNGVLRGAMVILPGSGNTGVDGDVSGPFTGTGFKGAPAKLSDQISEAMAQVGVATLRYEKRGFADSSQLVNQTMPFLISDAVVALSWLRSQVPGAKVGLIGLSEGALIATHISSRINVDALFLLSLPTRGIDDWFSYQFIQWPVELIRRRLDLNFDNVIDPSELITLRATFQLPYFGAPVMVLDANQDGSIDVTSELLVAYQGFFEQAIAAMQSPSYLGWYNGLKNLLPFEVIAPKVKAPVYLYQGQQDAQIYAGWIESDRRFFGGKTTLNRFSQFGHCFSPMEGQIGEIKTSGPLMENLLSTLQKDVELELN